MTYRSQNTEFLAAELKALQSSKKAREEGVAELGHTQDKVQRFAQSIV